MSEPWRPIYLSAKVFGHLSQGLYRTPAGAIKELISNSFDADSKLVRIHTDFPRFETFSCEDNGSGMSPDEFQRLMNRGIGSSYKRISNKVVTPELQRPFIGRLGLGILSLAQICTRFDIISHHKDSKSAFRATILFPAYTRTEMDKLVRRSSSSDADEQIQGGQFQIVDEQYDPAKHGLRIFTKYAREPFRKRMRSLKRYANKKVFNVMEPYKTFNTYLDAIYDKKTTIRSLNLLSDYDQLLFGLALASPLPYVADRNVAVQLPMIRDRQTELQKFAFRVEVDNMSLTHPCCLPSDRDGHTVKDCRITKSQKETFELVDGSARERLAVTQHQVTLKKSDERFNLYEIRYSNKDVAGSPLEFTGYLFQQTGRLYPRDIQGVLIRLHNVAIGKYDNSMLTYPYAEGPRYSMISCELFVKSGFEDALNIDRDSFNELHPHYIRVQSYIHSLLHDRIFPETWTEEKARNQKRRSLAAAERETRFVESYRKTTGDAIRKIQAIDKPKSDRKAKPAAVSPVEFETRRGQIEIDRTHPLLQPLFRRRKHAPIVEKLVIAFERSNDEATAARRREIFYRLLAEIFSEL